ncbi:MAG TPA: NAD-dependent epimerase/dehydratase family protein [Rhodopila sp.]
MTTQTVLLFGGRSFIGGHVCRVLLRRGYHVLLHSSSCGDFANLRDLMPDPAIEPVVCDLYQLDQLRELMGRSQFVVHAAIPYSKQSIRRAGSARRDLRRFKDTLTILAASDVRRSVFISVAGTIGRVAGGIADETRFAGEDELKGWGHLRQKIASETIIARYVRRGLDAVIVNPSMCIGEFDTKPSTGEFFRFFARCPFLLMPDALLNIVDVEDVALGVALAMEQGIAGQRYILSGTNTTMGALTERIRRLEGKFVPRFALPRRAAIATAYFFEILNLVLRRPAPAVPLLGVELIEQGSQHLTCQKAERGFGFAPKDAWQAVDRAHRWYQQNAVL